MARTPSPTPSPTSRPTRFWLSAIFVGALGALAAAAVAGAVLSLISGFDFAARRGWAVLSLASAAKGLSLLFIYKAFFALFVLPFALLALPLAYALVRQEGDDPYARLRFSAICLGLGALGPVALEAGLAQLTALALGGTPRLLLSPWLGAFGLFAGPAVAWAIWPWLRAIEERMTVQTRLEAMP